MFLHMTKLEGCVGLQVWHKLSQCLWTNEGCSGLLEKNGSGAFSLYFYTLSHSKQHGSWFEQPIFPFTPNASYNNCFIHWPSCFEEEDQNQFENFKATLEKTQLNSRLKWKCEELKKRIIFPLKNYSILFWSLIQW